MLPIDPIIEETLQRATRLAEVELTRISIRSVSTFSVRSGPKSH